MRSRILWISLALFTAAVSTSAATYTQVTSFGGTQKDAPFSTPVGLAVLPTGDLLVADRDHNQIKRMEDRATSGRAAQ